VTAKRVAAPAKLTPPRLLQSLPRERLFAWLDAHLDRRGIWLSGQPGAGKTMLTAGYLKARALPYIWYRLDADDNDIGTFFGMLGAAVPRRGRKSPLPPFSADHLHQPVSYARAWFRAVFAVLPRPMVLVFDNIEQAAMPALPLLLAIALEEATDGITLMITSRHGPPPELAGAVVADDLAVLEPAQLNFTADEASLYARVQGLDVAAVRTAAARVGGWAAGLRLLSHAGSTSPRAAAPHLLFDYFAGLLHDGLDPQGQQLLLVGALLPWIPADLAAELAGVADAADRLERLCEQNLFTERVGREGVYRFHPLFRDFLVERGRRTLDADARQALLRHAAGAFATRGEIDSAIDLAFEADDLPAATAWWLEVLEPKLARGQLAQLAAWSARIPDAHARDQPLLLYGRARVCFLREDPAALGHYASACAEFERRRDVVGQQLCAAGVLEWIYNTDSFIDHGRWCELMRRSAVEPPAREEHALRLLNGRLLACFYSGDFDRDAATWTDRVLDLLTAPDFANEKLSVAITLLGCLERAKRWDDAEVLAHRMEAMLESASPRLKVLVRQQIAADLHRQTGKYEAARTLALASLAQAGELGFAVLMFEAVAILLFAAQYVGDSAETDRLIYQLATLTEPGNIYHQRFARQMQAWRELQSGRLAPAREHADALRAAVNRSDMPAGFRATWLLVAIYVTFAEGRHAVACAELEALSGQAEAGSGGTLHANLLTLQAWCHLHGGRPAEARAALFEGWTLAASMRYYQLIAPLRTLLAQLCAFALEHDVAPVFTAELIRRRRLSAPDAAAAGWPWALRITTLGRFSIEADGAPLVFAGKVPRKPLALLKALIAFGGGSAVAQHHLIDALWPDDEADAAADAFNVALHRLRKLLPRGADAVQLHEGRLGLNPALCWTDAAAFEHAVSTDTRPGAVDREIESLSRALALYRGHFLAEEADQAWSLSTRERLRSKFKQAVVRCGRALIRQGRHDDALACYRQGLEIDDLDEDFYQGVMACALALQRPAEGLAAYQRLKRMLSILMGVAPSERSEALHRQLRG
jgi:DNA-binding SARP family transcriptional activator